MTTLLQQRIQRILEATTASHSQFINENNALQALAKDYAQKLARWQHHEQTLNIGIMGQVKAGKSTFLNTLLFDGRPILPEAATPKTANLTRIGYGEQHSLQVEYYSKEEWQQIAAQAQQSSSSDSHKVARELLEMSAHAGINLAAHWQKVASLDKNTEIVLADNISDLQGLLNTYTGNDGQLTPLVKSTTLTLPDETLKGFEVVDTPGMNDPVQSRSQKTRDYMANCDVVFFLSRCSQFLDDADIRLLGEQLPSKGVKRLVLVAGQYDSVILDDGYDRGSLAETENNIQKRLLRIAQQKSAELVEFQRGNGNDARATILEELAHPVFASTFAWGFAHWPQEKWSGSMSHTFNQLQGIAEECWPNRFTQQDWLRIANFDTLSKVWQQARQDRQPLLEQQRAAFTHESDSQLTHILAHLSGRLRSRIQLLENQDIHSLQQQQALCQKRLGGIASELRTILGDTIHTARQETERVKARLSEDIIRHRELRSHTGSKQERYSYEVSDSSWYNPFSWGSTRTVYDSRTVSYQYFSPQDAIEQVRQYSRKCASQIRQHFNSLIEPAVLKDKLRQALIQHLNTSSDQFEPTVFRSALENAIYSLELPELMLEADESRIMIPFQDEIKTSEDKQRLQNALDDALGAMFIGLTQQLTVGAQQIFSQLDTLKNTLQETLSENLETEVSEIKAGLQDKENEITGYRCLLRQLQDS
ncbi:dynamin family protein [Pectobacterium polonicum]|uniref:dynamin family protein n=1 Tax=Pectobacterium polonicum TaxID=2485124 RepID=UPI00375456C9